MVRAALIIFFLVSLIQHSPAQSLSFSRPQGVFPVAFSDKAPAVTGFRGSYIMSWKDTGTSGHLNICVLSGHQALETKREPYRLKQAVSLTAPAFQLINDRLYLFWIGTDSCIRYLSVLDEQQFEYAPANTLHTPKPVKFTLGICTVFTDSTLMITAHAHNKNRLLFAACKADSNHLLNTTHVAAVKYARTDAYPSMSVIDTTGTVRLCWADHRTRQLFFSDYKPKGKVWQLPQNFEGVYTERTPALMISNPGRNNITFIGRGADNHLWYDIKKDDETELATTSLPDYYAAAFRPSVVPIDSTGLIMAFTGADKKVYYGMATYYNPANWMGDLLYPDKAGYALKDIVLPGAHDAGMSVLNGVGGQGAAVINDCNTLTQVKNVAGQLQAGIRMFDLRIDLNAGELYTKHAPADCMEDAIGGGYGEKLSEILKAVKDFLGEHTKETVILSFCHFCEKEMPLREQAEKISDMLGRENILFVSSRKMGDLRLENLAGKAIVTFEDHAFAEWGIDANTMINQASDACINYRRCYAATNLLSKLLSAQQDFFTGLKGTVKPNDLVRLDWQLTEDSQEAVFICNDFESEKSNPLVDGAFLIANAIKKSKSIIELGVMGNRYLPGKIMDWIDAGVITKENKPNILYVDVAGNWITDFCVELNRVGVYQK